MQQALLRVVAMLEARAAGHEGKLTQVREACGTVLLEVEMAVKHSLQLGKVSPRYLKQLGQHG